MKLIEKIQKQLNEAGLYTVIDQFNDNSAKWIEIYQSQKHKVKGRSIGNIGFNIKGNKIIDISFHAKKNGTAFSLNY